MTYQEADDILPELVDQLEVLVTPDGYLCVFRVSGRPDILCGPGTKEALSLITSRRTFKTVTMRPDFPIARTGDCQ